MYIDKIIDCWRKLHNEELHNIYSSLNKISMIKPWRMRRPEHLAKNRRTDMCAGSEKQINH
jgi:hypothetical protein